MSEVRPCPQWSEVEAAADGRFGPREVDRVERHLAQCADCRAHHARWMALREEARTHAKAPVSELQRHRARAALLRAAAEGGEEPTRVASPLFAAGALSLAGAFALAAVVLSRAPAPPATRDPEARVEVVGVAHWTRSVDPARETVNLTEGALQVTVPHQRAGHRFVVALPDGELEVRGTRFVVEAHNGRTERVIVFEGLVALRVAHGPERLIAAGGRWPAHEDPPVAVRETAPTANTPAVPDPAVTAPAVTTPTPTVATRAAHTHTPHEETDAGAPFQHFAAGVAAMGRGDFRTAASSFEDFERQQPHDERADDAGWLRVVALRRAGDDASAITAAERYLRDYTSGAHRGEAASLLARSYQLRGDCARIVALASTEGARAGADELRRLRDRCAHDGGAP